MTQPTPNTELRAFLVFARRLALMFAKWVDEQYPNNKSQTPPIEFGAKSSTHGG